MVPAADPDDAERPRPIAPYGDDLDSFCVGVGSGTNLSGPRSSCSGGGRALLTCQLARGPSSTDDGLSTRPTLRPRPRVLGVALGTRVGVERPGEKPGDVAPAVRVSAGEIAPLGVVVPGAVRKFRPGALIPARLLPPTGAGRVGEPEEPVSNIFIRFDTRALLGVFVGEGRFGSGGSRAAPVRFVGVVRRIWNGDLLGTGGASEGALEYGGRVALESLGEVVADRAVWKLPATLETESGEVSLPSPSFGRAGDATELATGLRGMLLLGDGGSGKVCATAAASETVSDLGVLTLELPPAVLDPSRMPSPCPPSPAGDVG